MGYIVGMRVATYTEMHFTYYALNGENYLVIGCLTPALHIQ